MTILEIKLSLRDSIEQQARAAGLLTPEAIERLIEEAVQRVAGKRLLDAMRRLREANVPPLSEEEISAEVKAVRTTRRGAGEMGR